MATAMSDLFEPFGLNEYVTSALTDHLAIGHTSALNLAKSTGIPKDRNYGIVESLSIVGGIKDITGHPKAYQRNPPKEILKRAIENRRQSFENVSG